MPLDTLRKYKEACRKYNESAVRYNNTITPPKLEHREQLVALNEMIKARVYMDECYKAAKTELGVL